MLILYEKVNKYLEIINLSRYKLSKMIGCSESALSQMTTGKRAMSESLIESIAPILSVSVNEIIGWTIADKYSKEVIERAIKAKKEKQDDKLILTTKLDEVLKSKNISRTSLSKIIDYSQGSLNEMIISKKPISKSVISRLSVTLEIPEDEIRSWIAADKYSLESFEIALREL